MAEREGFEPPIALRLCLISSQVHSTGLCHLSVNLTGGLPLLLCLIDTVFVVARISNSLKALRCPCAQFSTVVISESRRDESISEQATCQSQKPRFDEYEA
jgi:hypothetical protein